MSYQELAEELCELHFLYSKELSNIIAKAASQGEERVLLYLWRHQGQVLSGELTKELRLTSGRMANILRVLEKKKYIERRIDAQDKRKVKVILQEKGRVFIMDIYKRRLQEHQKLLEELGTKDSRELIRLMKKAIHITDPSLLS